MFDFEGSSNQLENGKTRARCSKHTDERCVECADGTRFLLDPRVSDEVACKNHGGVKKA